MVFAKAHTINLYMPKIGCGLGGLSWTHAVKPLVSRLAVYYQDVNIFVCDIEN